MDREKVLKVVLILVGLIFSFVVYPLMMVLWPSGWRWQPNQPEYEQMILGGMPHSGLSCCSHHVIQGNLRRTARVTSYVSDDHQGSRLKFYCGQLNSGRVCTTGIVTEPCLDVFAKLPFFSLSAISQLEAHTLLPHLGKIFSFPIAIRGDILRLIK